MSVSMYIQYSGNLSVGEVKKKATEQLEKITGLTGFPNITFNHVKKGVESLADDCHIIVPEDHFYVRFSGFEEVIIFGILEEGVQWFEALPDSQEDLRMAAFLSANLNFPIKYLLAAGVVLAMSDLCKSPIEDGACYWSENLENSYEEFFDAVQIRDKLPDQFKEHFELETLARFFCDNLNSPRIFKAKREEMS